MPLELLEWATPASVANPRHGVLIIQMVERRLRARVRGRKNPYAIDHFGQVHGNANGPTRGQGRSLS
eukprot:11495166-Alexandrium_andersonii.AAC.1